MITWKELVTLEPELARLLQEIRAVKDTGGPSFCANLHWYGNADRDGFKAQFKDLVGYTARSRDPRVRTSEAYSLAYEKLYGALPDCRNCWC